MSAQPQYGTDTPFAPSVAIAQAWGWANPAPEILAVADLAHQVRTATHREAEALIRLGVLPEPTVRQMQAQCPPGESLVEFAREREPTLVAPRFDALACVLDGLPYYPRLSMLGIHAGMADNAALAARCASLDCILLTTDAAPVAVFSSIRAMRQHRSLGRAERAACPIEAAAGARLQYAIGEPDEIQGLLQQYRGDGGRSDVENVLVWNANSAETDEQEEGRHLRSLIDHAVSVGATDIKIAQSPDGEPEIFIRRNGRLIRPKVGAVADRQVVDRMIALLESKSGANPAMATYRTPQNGQLRYRSRVGDVVMRLSFIPLNHLGQLMPLRSVSIRIFTFRDKPVDLQTLGLQADVQKAIDRAVHQRQGLVLVVGPTNSGKSTTIAGALDLHRRTHGDALKRLTVEDPVERMIPGVTQFQVPPRAVSETGAVLNKVDRLAMILHAALRHDPDVIFVGEIPGAEMAQLCVEFAASGHLALSTLHANSAVLAFERLRNMLSADMAYQLAESLLLIVGQRLIPTVCRCCGHTRPATDDDRAAWAEYLEELGLGSGGLARPVPAGDAGAQLALPAELTEANPDGCQACDRTGYEGVAPINEVLPFTRKIRDAACAYVGGANERGTLAAGRTVTFAHTAHQLIAGKRVSLNDVITQGR